MSTAATSNSVLPEVFAIVTLWTVPSGLTETSRLTHRFGVVERIVGALVVEVLEEAEAPQLVDAAVHARDVERERMRARLERGLVAGADVGDEVLERALDRVELALPAALLARHLARRDLALLVDLLLAHDALVVLERERRVEAGQALLADLLAVLALLGDRRRGRRCRASRARRASVRRCRPRRCRRPRP